MSVQRVNEPLVFIVEYLGVYLINLYISFVGCHERLISKHLKAKIRLLPLVICLRVVLTCCERVLVEGVIWHHGLLFAFLVVPNHGGPPVAKSAACILARIVLSSLCRVT